MVHESTLGSLERYYDTSNMMHAGAMIKMFAIWLFVSFPLVIAGTLFGRHMGGKNDFPCRVNTIPRPIPAGPWYTASVLVVPLTGILPFGSIFIEMSVLTPLLQLLFFDFSHYI